MICPICNKEIKRSYGHFKTLKDEHHQNIFNQQLDLVLSLFYDYSFNSSNLEEFNVLFPYSSCLEIWKNYYGLSECKNRANKLNALSVSKAMTGKVLSDEHKRSLSDSHIGQKAWNKGLTVEDPRIRNIQNKRNETMSRVLTDKYKNGEMIAWKKGKNSESNPELKEMHSKISKKMASKQQNNSRGISGIRKDIGHHAASTYEANIYRILQFHQCNYKKEFDIIKSIVLPGGEEKYYRIDIQDIDGIFGIKNAYIEVKGFYKEKDREKVRLFREQYQDEKLLLIGNGDKRPQYYWEPDVDYSELEKKYKSLIPLWEDKNQNLKTHPHLYT